MLYVNLVGECQNFLEKLWCLFFQSIVSSPQDFDPRILVSEPLMFLNWYNNPDVTIYREPRKAIPLSSKVRRSHHRVQRPLTNEQILSIS